ncbi:MAG: hypothetical protein LBE12_04380, partial [Planctomycetaceae bacterium]|nr:hypothetical protein [Planctomycetaceae bacterium]
MSNEKITINTEDLSTEPIVSTTASSTPFQPVQTKPPITLHQQTVISSYNMKFVVILMLLNFLLTLVLCVGVGYLAFY